MIQGHILSQGEIKVNRRKQDEEEGAKEMEITKLKIHQKHPLGEVGWIRRLRPSILDLQLSKVSYTIMFDQVDLACADKVKHTPHQRHQCNPGEWATQISSNNIYTTLSKNIHCIVNAALGSIWWLVSFEWNLR